MTGAQSERDLPVVGRIPDAKTAPDADALGDLHERLIQKRNLLQKMASETRGSTERSRLLGKAEGVDLALSFIEEMRRGA